MSTAAVRKTVLLGALLLFAAYAVLLVVGSRAEFPPSRELTLLLPYLPGEPLGEDGYYMLTAAWNLAETGALEYTFGMSTTGVQPLYTFVLAGVSRVIQTLGGDRWMLARAALLLGLLTCLAAAHLTGAIAAGVSRREEGDGAVYAAGFLLALFSPWVFRWHLTGLETGLYHVVLLWVVWMSLRARRQEEARWSTYLALGAIAGLAGLTRLDFGILFAGFLVFHLAERPSRLPELAGAGTVALGLVSPWFLYVRGVTGSWMPSSGTAQAGLLTFGELPGRSAEFFMAVLSNALPWAYHGGRTWLVAASGALLVILCASIALLWRKSPATRRRLTRYLRCVAPWIPGAVALSLIYGIFFTATNFYGRYLFPLAVLWIPVVALLAPDLKRRGGKVALDGALVALVGLWAATVFRMYHDGRLNEHGVNAGVVREHVPHRVVGAFQSGAIGYYNENVVNLDGTMNHRALAAARADTLEEYIDGVGITVLVDWPEYLSRLEPGYLASWEECPFQEEVAKSRCYRR